MQLTFTHQLLAQETNKSTSWQNQRLHDTLRLQLLDSLIRKVHWRKQVDSSLYYIHQQEQLAQMGGWEKWKIIALKNRGALYYAVGDYLACIPAQEMLISVYDTTSAFRELSEAHRKLAYALRKTNQNVKSLKHYHDCLRFAEAAGEDGKANLAAGLNSLGSYYLNRRAYDLAKEKYLASLALHQSINRTKGIYSNLNNLGLVYAMTEDYDKAIEYYQISLEIKKKVGDKRRIANTYGNIGDIYLAWGKEEEAQQYFLQAKTLQEELGLRDELARSLTQLGNLARQQGRPREAVDWCEQSCAIAQEDQLWQAALACHKCLYEAHKTLGNPTIALAEHEAYTAIKDSVFNTENNQNLAQMEARLIYEKELLAAEKEQLILTNQVKHERLLRWTLVGATFGLALLSWLAFRIGRLRKRQNVILSAKNDQISKDRKLIQQQADQVKETASIKDRFFTNISHELRTPLTLVSSPLGKLLEQDSHALPKPVQSTLNTVKNNADKLLYLVEELLELSQLEAGTAKLYEDTLIILPFLKQLFSNYQSLAQEQHIDFEFTADIPPSLKIQTDQRRLEKIIDNLLNNAFKFTPIQSRIQLSISQVASIPAQLTISVTDNGPGIPAKDLPHIFDRYYQGSHSPERGTGIGLAFARESARLLGGEIKVESELETGSVFTFIFPIKETPSIILSESTDSPVDRSMLLSNENRKALRILIVEDNQELQDFLSELLQSYSFTNAKNGKEALTLLRQAHTQKEPFHLVLTDLMMPEMDGTTLIKQIKQSAEFIHTKVIVLTARQDLSEKLILLRFGVDDYLTKPFSAKELQLRVHNLLQYPIETNVSDNSSLSVDEPSFSWLEKVEQQVEELLVAKQKLSAGSLASALHLSNRQLLRKIQAATGMSTQLYLQECKLQLAQRYLETRQYTTIQEVAAACGFNTPNYFSKLYGQRFGRRPEGLLKNRLK